MDKIRVRFAPSPTGYLHIGGARTALFNWLFARQNQGTLVLRIEDTDTGRLKEDSVSQILTSLHWLGIEWDEGPEKGGPVGPYFQSERQEKYRLEAERLVREGKAYYCFCSPEELEAERENQRKAGMQFSRYSGKCCGLSPEEVQARLARGDRAVIRVKTPKEGETVVRDLIRGNVSFQNEQLDDFIILKSNGMPAYNFACVVDDHAMAISHVIRAEEHLSNTPKQVFLYELMGYELPQFAHLSMILAPDRSKLSKRHGATSVEEFREQGYLAESIVNYLTLLGWAPGEENEIFSPEDTVRHFSLEKVSKTAAIYDVQKLTWMNSQYMMSLDLDALIREAAPFFYNQEILTPEEMEKDYDHIRQVVEAVRGRAKTLPELARGIAYFFRDFQEYDEKGINKSFRKEGAIGLLTQGKECLQSVEDFSLEQVETAYRGLIERLGIKAGDLIHPTRLALTGRTEGPGLFDIIRLLGREKCLQRLDQAIAYIGNLQ